MFFFANTTPNRTCEVVLELAEGALHEVLHLQPLLLGDPGGESVALQAATNTDPESGSLPLTQVTCKKYSIPRNNIK